MSSKLVLEQIQKVTEKLYHLNKVFLQSEEISTVEMSVVKKYVSELEDLCEKLKILSEEDRITKVNFGVRKYQGDLRFKNEEPNPQPLPEMLDYKPIEISTPSTEQNISNANDKTAQESFSSKPIHQENANNKTSINDKLNQNKSAVLDKIGFQQAKSIKKLISISDNYFFKSELFNGNQNLYEEALQQIDKFQNYEECQQWIEEVYAEQFQWHKKKESVEHFKIILKNRFV